MQTDGVAVGLRLVELVALLIPAVAILLQLVVNTIFKHSDEPFVGTARLGFALLAGSIVVLASVGVNTLSDLTERTGADWIIPRIDSLLIAVWGLMVGSALLLYHLYKLGRPSEGSNEVGDEPPKGIE
ncbi:hypothetical protein ACFQJ5_16725 [Halomicroarcula sp. GCM10025324]|uniref:hypothetical protein n=1 Tax=Haloarcula TaxID=2237 RepID=UPI0023E7DE95|nr:hypothetical protein [Halomicroarcula sp. ZS-22-S1]